MRSSSEALKIALSNINLVAQNGKYHTAAKLATNFIKLSYNLESKKELFLGELLESVFTQISQEFEMREIPDIDKENLSKKINQHMTNLLTAYDTQNDLCDVLVDMRNDATIFQFTASTQYNIRKPDIFTGDMNEK